MSVTHGVLVRLGLSFCATIHCSGGYVSSLSIIYIDVFSLQTIKLINKSTQQNTQHTLRTQQCYLFSLLLQ